MRKTVWPKWAGFAFRCVAAATVACALAGAAVPARNSTSAARATAAAKALNLPLYFIENQGQAHPEIRYYLQGRGTVVYFTDKAMYVTLTGRNRTAGIIQPASHRSGGEQRWTVRLDLVGARGALRPEGVDRSPAVVSYFKGNPADWKTNLPAWRGVMYREVWPGIDLVWEDDHGKLKSSFIVAPGADPAQIQLAWRGAASVRIGKDGEMRVDTPVGGFSEQKPFAFQQINGRQVAVSSNYVLDGESYSFRLGQYDRGKPLVIDPLIVYSGFIGGQSDDEGFSVAIDSSGSAYVVGATSSFDAALFPRQVGPDLTYNGGSNDAFIAKVNAAGNGLVYSGYIGGAGDDRAYSVAVGSDGSAYVIGDTNSTSFPHSGAAFQACRADGDAFVAKVNAGGTALTYSGCIGGSGIDSGRGIAVDSSGNAYVTGFTYSTETSFPDQIGPDTTHNGGSDAFVAKVNAAGSSLDYAGFIGGSGDDSGIDLAVDSSGNAYVAGQTASNSNFPTTSGAYDTSYNGGASDGFVAKVSSSGSSLTYCTFLGGSGEDIASGIAVNSANQAYVTGLSGSSDFPVLTGPDTSYNGGSDAFVTKLNSTGSGLEYSGFIGGSGLDWGNTIALDAAGNAYIGGQTSSSEASFPVKAGPDLTYNGGTSDAFVAAVSPSGSSLIYASYVGGSAEDFGYGIAADAAGSVYLAGKTHSTETTFPNKVGPDLSYNGGFYDAFIVKITSSFDRIGVRRDTRWILDTDGNGAFESAVDRDFFFGWAGATYVTGDWNGDGRDKVGYYLNGFWFLDYDGNGVWDNGVVDKVYGFGFAGVQPVVGDWNGDGRTKIGLYKDGFWFLDYDGNGSWDGGVTDKLQGWGWVGATPFVGDWNGDGRDKIGVYSAGFWFLDYDGNYIWDAGVIDKQVGWGWIGATPIVGDWNGDGKTDISVYSAGFWFQDYDGNYSWDMGVVDRIIGWGWTGTVPISGDWNGDGRDKVGAFVDGTFVLDFNGNGAWDGDVTDFSETWGVAGDQPAVGRW